MKTQNFLVSAIFFITSLLLLALPLHAQISKAEKLYEEGVYQLEANGNFEEAIVIFNRVVKEFPGNKPVAAKALLKLGFCYERQGNQKATEVYEQIISQYSDQVNLVTQARDRLAALQKIKTDGLTINRFLPMDIYLECMTLSPDGTKLAGIDFSSGQNVAVYDIGTRKMNLLTDYNWSKESCWTYTPVWSPDGTEIVHYVGYRGDPAEEYIQLKITSLDGKSRVLFKNTDGEGVAPCDWFPDKSAILAGSGTKDGLYKLILIFTKDGISRELCTLQRTFRVQDVPMAEVSGSADVSPDGKFIVFTDGPVNQQRNIYIISAYGGPKMILNNHPADHKEPRWSPDGQHIVFLSTRSGNWALWGLAVKDGQADGTPFLIRDGMQGQNLASWTQKGLCTCGWMSFNDIYTLEIDPLNMRALGKPRILESTIYGKSLFPVWSPDGKYLAYMSNTQSDNSQNIMIMPFAGGEIRKFNRPLHAQMGILSWLPNGNVGYINKDNKGNTYLSQLDQETGEWNTKLIFSAGEFSGPANFIWNKEVKSFYYLKRDKEHEQGIVSHDLETGNEKYILHDSSGDSLRLRMWSILSASRDLKHLAFNSESRIGLMNIETGNLRYIKIGDQQNLVQHVWSPDGKYLLAKGSSKIRTGMNELFIISTTDGKITNLNIGQYLPRGSQILYSIDWSPDGSTIVFDITSVKSEANLIQNVIPGK
jgi:Tol biopolymer transport system component